AVYSDLDAMLAAGGLDAVHVLLPADLHFDAARRLLEAGLDVLVEKPLCPTVDECAALAGIPRRQGRPVAVSHTFLFCPVDERLKAALAAGLLGRIEHVDVVWRKELGLLRSGPFGAWMFRAPGNVLLEVGPHSTAHLLDLLGRPDSLEAEADRPV